jgi:hypothetical protein
MYSYVLVCFVGTNIFPCGSVKDPIRNRIHRIRMFLGLPDPEPFVRDMYLAPDPSLFLSVLSGLKNAYKIKISQKIFSKKLNY